MLNVPNGGTLEDAGAADPPPTDLMTLSPDLTALDAAPDLAKATDLPRLVSDATVASDLAPPPASVACGMMTCSGAEGWCCFKRASFTHSCVAKDDGCDSLVKCDGKEDCGGDSKLCCATINNDRWVKAAACAASCASGNSPLCHQADASDCPPGQGFAHCCPIGRGIYSYCSKTPC